MSKLPHGGVPRFRGAQCLRYLRESCAALSEAYSNVRTEAEEETNPDDPRTRIRKEIEEAGLFPHLPNLLSLVYDFYCERVLRTTEEMQLRYLLLLLFVLDEHFEQEPLQVYSDAQGDVLLGRRWWASVARHEERRRPINFGRSVHDAYPHLRILGQNIRVAQNVNTALAFAQLGSVESLRIACCTLSGQARTNFVGTGPFNWGRGPHFGFRATHVGAPNDRGRVTNPESAYIDELRNTLTRARREAVHVLFLPELSVCEQGRSVLRDAIELDPGDLILVVPGSFHVSGVGSNAVVNAAPVWLVHRDPDAAGGKVVTALQAEKSEIFDLPTARGEGVIGLKDPVDGARSAGFDQLAEHIVPSSTVQLLDTPVGSLLVLICKDALVGPVDGHVQRAVAAADHVVVVSMNANPRAWFSPVALLWQRTGTATYYVNSAQALNGASPSMLELAAAITPRGLKDATGTFYGQVGFRDNLPLQSSISPELRATLVDDWFCVDIPAPRMLR